MADFKQIQEVLLVRLAAAVKLGGFRRSRQSFRRATGWGWQSFHVSFVPRPHDFAVTADVAIRHDAIEKLVSENSGPLSKQASREVATLGNDLGYLSTGQPLRRDMRGVADLPIVCAQILSAFESTGLLFFDRFSSLADVLEALSAVGNSGRLYLPLDDVRAQKAVAAAFLLGRRDTFHRLVGQYQRYLEQNGNAFGLSQFVPFAEKLAKRRSAGGPEAGTVKTREPASPA